MVVYIQLAFLTHPILFAVSMKLLADIAWSLMLVFGVLIFILLLAVIADAVTRYYVNQPL